jgi:hypothetical protein
LRDRGHALGRIEAVGQALAGGVASSSLREHRESAQANRLRRAKISALRSLRRVPESFTLSTLDRLYCRQSKHRAPC